jgi:hypothetical protein
MATRSVTRRRVSPTDTCCPGGWSAEAFLDWLFRPWTNRAVARAHEAAAASTESLATVEGPLTAAASAHSRHARSQTATDIERQPLLVSQPKPPAVVYPPTSQPNPDSLVYPETPDHEPLPSVPTQEPAQSSAYTPVPIQQ